MRTLKVRHIDTGIAKTGRVSLSVSEIDDMISHALNEIQLDLGKEWDLLSVAPVHRGVFVTTWEYDPELHEAAVAEAPKEENVFHTVLAAASYPKIVFGDIIEVNGVAFKLTHFGQSGEESMVTFTPLSELEEIEAAPLYHPSLRPRTQYRPGTFGRR